MNTLQPRRSRRAFTLIELMVVVLILGVLASIALPGYLSSVYGSRAGTANANARALSESVQARAVTTGSYDTVLSDYAIDMGGTIPVNPCTGTSTGYTITSVGSTATITPSVGTNCGTWTPQTFNISR